MKGALETKIEKCEIFIQMANCWCRSSLNGNLQQKKISDRVFYITITNTDIGSL